MLELQGIRKAFNGVEVLHGVDFMVGDGVIHGLVGHNGAGKSTLMKIVRGVYRADAGVVRIDGREVRYKTVAEARLAGIGMVFQEFSLVPTLPVYANVGLSSLRPHPWSRLRDREMIANAERVFKRLGVNVDPRRPVSSLTLPEQQVTEIAKALSQDLKVLVLDEPTAALSGSEVDELFAVMRTLRAQGVPLIFVSHRLREVLEVCDELTVLRDGRVAHHGQTKGITVEALVDLMIGTVHDRAGNGMHQHREGGSEAQRFGEQPVLQLQGVATSHRAGTGGITFSAHSGELLGVVGALGSGVESLAGGLAGVTPFTAGRVLVNGESVRLRTPADAARAGIGVLPSDNRRAGLVMTENIDGNISLMALKRLRRFFSVSPRAVHELAKPYVTKLGIGKGDGRASVRTLSGGNQRKVAVAKVLASAASVLIFDEATAGVDVGVRRDIIDIARAQAAQGDTVVWIGSDIEEVIEVADRIIAVREGSVIADLANTKHDLDARSVMNATQ
jgi:ribose transport system ATP-binding protein